MPTIKQRLADILLKEDRQRLSAASSALLDVYQRWPALVRQSMTQSETERLGELDSRLVDLLARQQQTGQYQGYELTEADRLGAVYASRRAYDNDVLMEAVIDSWSSFGFGTSVDVVPRDPEAKLVWDAFWHAPQNGYLLNQKRVQDMSTYLLRDGDYLLVFYISTLDGSCIVRRVDTTEIQGGPEGTGVICLPQDREVPVLYRRQATGQDSTQAQYIRDWRATDAMVAQVREAEGWSFDDGVFLDEVKPTTRVVALHVAHKVRQLRGWPLMTTGLPWSAAYKNFLQDRAAIARAAAMYFEKVKVKGGQRVIDSLTAAMQSSLVHNTSAYETNPIPAAGSRWIENEQAELSRLPMSTGSGDAQVDGAMLKAQAALAGRMPSHWLGSGQDVQWATAQEMRLPILRALNGYGLFWSATWAEMAEIVLTAAEKYSPAAPKYSTYEVDVNTDAMNTIEIDQVIALMAELDSAVGAGWSAADYARVYPYLIRTALQTIGIKNTDDILPVSAAAAPVVADGAAVAVVPPAAVPAQPVAAGEGGPQQEAFMEARPFGPEAYQRGLTRAARGLWSGALDANAFYAMASNAVAVGLTDAWHAGAAKCGVLPADLSPEELAALAGVIAAEYGYISNLLDYVDANSKANGGKLAALEPRLHMWAMRWGETHDKAQAMACKDKKLMWTMGDAEHSPDCLKLHGKVKRGSEWTASGILPRSDKLDCSLGCQCSLMPTDKPISRGPLPTLAGQMGESNTAAEGGPGSGPSQIR